MKLLKKLLAVTLAGVLALTMLTGCGQSVNEKQLVDALNDLHYLAYANHEETGVKTIVQGDNKLATQVLGEIKTYVSSHPNPGYNADAIFDMYGSSYLSDSFTDITKDSKDAYYYTYMRLDEFQSKEFSKNKTAFIATNLYNRRSATLLNDIDFDPDNFETTATASIATDKIGDYEYLVIIFVQKCTGENTARSD